MGQYPRINKLWVRLMNFVSTKRLVSTKGLNFIGLHLESLASTYIRNLTQVLIPWASLAGVEHSTKEIKLFFLSGEK